MGEKTITISYGKYKHIDFKRDETTIKMKWDVPEGIEDKYATWFDQTVSGALDKLEKELSGGASTAKKFPGDLDAKIDVLVTRYATVGILNDRDCKSLEEFRDMLPDCIENLEQQRVKIIESMLGQILDDAVEELAKKLKDKVRNKKIKKVVTIAAVAVVALLAATAAILVSVMTFGVAAVPIIGLIGACAGALGSGVGVALRARSIWKAGKDEAKDLETSSKAYAAAAVAFKQVLDRQKTQITLKDEQLRLIEKHVDEHQQHMKKLETMFDNLKTAKTSEFAKTVAKNMAECESEIKSLTAAEDALRKDLEKQSALLKSATEKTDYDAALSLATAMKEDQGYLEKISGHLDKANTAIGIVGNLVQAAS